MRIFFMRIILLFYTPKMKQRRVDRICKKDLCKHIEEQKVLK